ncbi:MAG: SprB repeat-containing protein [Saprospiraceae bacterium]
MIGMLASLSAQLSVEFTATEPSCFNFSNGTITAMGQNGTDPYSYQWNNNQTGPTLIGIGAGNYIVTVTDADGQMVVDSFLLGQPDSLSVNIRPQGSICDGSSGNFLGSGIGGTPPYTYIWSNRDRDSILETPAAGFYALTINDSKGCKAFETLVVIDPLEVEVVTSDVVCAGACDGTARAIVRGGEPPYTFLWNWRADTNQILPNVDPGYYEVTVTDARGCTGIAGDTIHEPDSININLTIEYDTCGPGAKATVTANPDGGTPPYTFMWDNGDTDSTTMYMGLSQHSVTVTDANNCKADTIFMIYDTGTPMVVIDSINPNCADSTGKAIARIWGGTPPFTYMWNTGDTTMMIGGLPAGTYWVKVTDRNGCMGSDTVTLVNEDNLEIEVTGENPLCNGVDNGKATVTVLNGTPPYTYLWSTGGMTNMITDLVQAGIMLLLQIAQVVLQWIRLS